MRNAKHSTMDVKGWVVAVLQNIHTGEVKIIRGRNLISNDGDIYYAKLGSKEMPTYDFAQGGLILGTGTSTPTKTDKGCTTIISGTYKTIYPGYPKTNDDDTNNDYYGNADYITYKYFYGRDDANVEDISEGAIINKESSPDAGLCHFLFDEPFTKDNTYYLTVYVNHEFLGE